MNNRDLRTDWAALFVPSASRGSRGTRMGTEGTDNVNMHERLDVMQRMTHNAGEQLAWLVAKICVTWFVSGAITLATGYMRDMRDNLRTVSSRVEAQNTQSMLQQQRVENLSKVSDATVSALQSLSRQVDHNTYDVNALKAAVDYNATHGGSKP